MIDIINLLTSADWITFGLLQVMTIMVIIWGHRYLEKKAKHKESSVVETLLMGRRLTLPVFIATLVATWYGGIFGVTALSYEKGIFNFITQGVFWYITYLIFALWLAPKVNLSKALSLSDLVGQHFGAKSAKLAAILNLFNVIPIAYTISIGVLIQAFTNWSLMPSMSVGILFVCFYSAWGGLRSVVLSDIIQFFLMLIAVVWVTILSITTFGFTDYLEAHLTPTHLSPTGGENLSTLFIWGFIALSTLVDPNFYQRCLAAENPKTARNGILLSTLVWFVFDICTTLGGLYAYSWSQDLAPNQAYLVYALNILPPIGRGIFLAGICATILSTLDSYLFISSITITHDLLKIKNFKNWHHTLGVFIIGVLSLILAELSDGSIASIWKLLGSLSSACLLLPVLCHYVIPGKISDIQFTICSLLSAFSIIFWKIFTHYYLFIDIDVFYIGITTCIISLSSCQLYNHAHEKYQNRN